MPIQNDILREYLEQKGWDDPGIYRAPALEEHLYGSPEELMAAKKAWRRSRPMRNEGIVELLNHGYTLEDLGFQNIHELGKTAFDKFGSLNDQIKQKLATGQLQKPTSLPAIQAPGQLGSTDAWWNTPISNAQLPADYGGGYREPVPQKETPVVSSSPWDEKIPGQGPLDGRSPKPLPRPGQSTEPPAPGPIIYGGGSGYNPNPNPAPVNVPGPIQSQPNQGPVASAFARGPKGKGTVYKFDGGASTTTPQQSGVIGGGLKGLLTKRRMSRPSPIFG
jgi:hypothetical protein